jgi:prolyl 4-hydroxylase
MRPVYQMAQGALDGFRYVDDYDMHLAKDGVVVMPGLVTEGGCQLLREAAIKHRPQASSMAGSHDHFDGRVVYVSNIPAPLVQSFAARTAKGVATIAARDLNGGADIQEEGPQLVWWPAPHGMDWHEDASFPGDRTHSFIVYLNDDYEGGALCFRDLRVMVRPKTGTAVAFKAPLFHGVQTVTAGERYTLASWGRATPIDTP